MAFYSLITSITFNLVVGSAKPAIEGIKVVMENFKRVHDSIRPQVLSPASSPNLSESSYWLGGLWSRARPWTDRAHCARAHSPPAKLDLDVFDNSAGDQTCWLD